jgi:Cu-Zn family superoxide dismutase
MLKMSNVILCCLALACSSCLYAEMITIELLDPTGGMMPIGTVTAVDTKYGLLLTPNLSDLPPGQHGFHVHENPSCGEIGKSAGGHLDPQKTNKHHGPYNDDGHFGDLPAMYVDSNGQATTPVLAPRLKSADIKNHAMMIHAGGDNYSDNPANGGGGERLGCGVIKG